MLELVAFAAVLASESSSAPLMIAWIAFASAIGTAVIGGPLMWFLNKMTARSKEERAEVAEVSQRHMDTLDRVVLRLERLDERFYDHMEFHAARPEVPPVVVLRRERKGDVA